MKTVSIMVCAGAVTVGPLACSAEPVGEWSTDLKGGGNSQSQVTITQGAASCGESCFVIHSSKDVGFITVDATGCGQSSATISLHPMIGSTMGPAIERTPVANGNGKACPNIPPGALKYDELGGHDWAVCVKGAKKTDLLVKSGQTCATQSFAGQCGAGSVTATGDEVWRRDLGPGVYYITNDVATDPDGNVIHAKRSLGVGGRQGLTKFDPLGDELWRFPYGDVVATDAGGDVYAAGMFDTPIDLGFGTMTPQGASDVFVAKLDPNGHALWAKQFGTDDSESVQSIAVAASNRIILSGDRLGTLELDENGAIRFSRGLSGAVAFDSGGNVLVSGGNAGPLDLGNGEVRNDDGTHAFVVKLDPNGTPLWYHLFGNATGALYGSQMGTAIAVAPNDDIVFGGEISSNINLFGRNYTMPPDHFEGGYVSRLDASGAEIWSHVTIAMRMLNDIATDSSGNAIVSSTLDGNVIPFHITFLHKLDPSGALLWAHEQWPLGTLGYGGADGVATDRCGNIYWAVTSRTGSPSDNSAFLMRLAP